jgi:alpha-L-rhamnosidase
MSLWTFENLSLGGYVVDCPQRERMGYGGDAHASTQMALNNYELGAFYTKWAQDWRDAQSADGNLPYTAPTYWGGGGPIWCGFCIHLPWEVYLRYGDVRILRDQFPTIERWLAFMETHAKDNLLVRWGGEWDFLGDWLWPGADGVNGDTPETLCLNNCYWVYALRTAAKIADILGEKWHGQLAREETVLDPANPWPKKSSVKSDSLGAHLRAQADRVSAAINSRFYNPKTHEYANGDQAYLATALLAGVPDSDERGAVMARLEDEILVHRKGHIWAGITGGALLTRELLNAGRADLLYSMAIQPEYPGWGDFISKGHTTFPEDWQGGQSQLHSSFLFIGAWFIEGLAGITQAPGKAGFRHFVIRPLVACNPPLEYMSASMKTPYGQVAVSWKLKDGRLNMRVVVPPNTTATLYMPINGRDPLTLDGHPLRSAAGVEAETQKMLIDLQPGAYKFESPYMTP